MIRSLFGSNERDLRAAIAGLPAEERVVLALLYCEELDIRQVAEVLNLTGSRVSKIRARALRRLDRCLAELPDEVSGRSSV